MRSSLRRIARVLLAGSVVGLLLGSGCRPKDEAKTGRETDTEPAVKRVIQWRAAESRYKGRTVIHGNGSSRDEP